MKITIISVLMVFVVFFFGCGREYKPGNSITETRTQDKSGFSESAPAVHTLMSSLSRIVVIRLRDDTDLLEGLQSAITRENIRDAVILSGFCTLTSDRVHFVDKTSLPPEESLIRARWPQDLLDVEGYVVDGRAHAEIKFSSGDNALGGHLKRGTRVFASAIITLVVLDKGADFARADDRKW